MSLAPSDMAPPRSRRPSRVQRKALFVAAVALGLGVLSYVERDKGPPPPLFHFPTTGPTSS